MDQVQANNSLALTLTPNLKPWPLTSGPFFTTSVPLTIEANERIFRTPAAKNCCVP